MAKTGFFQTNTVVEETGTSLSETTSTPASNDGKPKSSFYSRNQEYEEVANGSGFLTAAEASATAAAASEAAAAASAAAAAASAASGIDNVVEDLTPQLGGNFDLLGHYIFDSIAGDSATLNASQILIHQQGFLSDPTIMLSGAIEFCPYWYELWNANSGGDFGSKYIYFTSYRTGAGLEWAHDFWNNDTFQAAYQTLTTTDVTPGSEDAKWDQYLVSGGSVITVMTLGTTDAFGDYSHTFNGGSHDFTTLTVQSSAATANGPGINFYHNSASPAASDQIGFLGYIGKDSAGNVTQYAAINTSIVDATNGSEDSQITFPIKNGGSDLTALTLGDHSWSGGSAPGVLFDLGASASQAVVIKSENAGNLNQYLTFWIDSPSPANSDQIGSIQGYGNDSLGFDFFYDNTYYLQDANSATLTTGWTLNLQSQGAVTASYYLTGGANFGTGGWSDLAAFDFGPIDAAVLALQNSSVGTFGPGITGYHNSASPAAADVPFTLEVWGKDSLANAQQIGTLRWVYDDSTSGSEDTELQAYIVSGGSNIRALTLGSFANFSGNAAVAHVHGDSASEYQAIVLQADNGGSGGAYFVGYHNTPSPADDDDVGGLQVTGKNDAATSVVWGNLDFYATDVSAGTEDSKAQFLLVSNGASFNPLILNGSGGFHYLTTPGINDFEGFVIQSTAPGGGGPYVYMKHYSPSPAANDYIGGFAVSGRDNALNETQFFAIDVQMSDVTNGSEDSLAYFNVYSGGSNVTALTLGTTYDNTIGVGVANTFAHIFDGGSTTFPSLVFQGSDPSGGGPVIIAFNNSASPAATDTVGQFVIHGNDSLGARVEYGAIAAKIVDPTTATQDSSLQLYCMSAGTELLALNLGASDTPWGSGISGSHIFRSDTIGSGVIIHTTNAGPEATWFQIHHDSASPADGDSLGQLFFDCNNDIGTKAAVYAGISGVAVDVSSGTEDSRLDFGILSGGLDLTPLKLEPTQTFISHNLGGGGFYTYVGSASFEFYEEDTYPLVQLSSYRSVPADGDVSGHIKFLGWNDVAPSGDWFNAGQIKVTNTDITDGTEDSKMELSVQSGGSDLLALTLGTINTIDGDYSHVCDFGSADYPELVLQNTSAAGGGPLLMLYQNSASPGANDTPGGTEIWGKNSAAALVGYGKSYVQIVDTTNGSEDSMWWWQIQSGGALLNALTLGTTDAFTNPSHKFSHSGDGPTLNIECTNAGTTGPFLTTYHDSASPANSDLVGGIDFNGKDSGGNVTNWVDIAGTIVDVTNGSEDSSLTFTLLSGGSTLAALNLMAGGTFQTGHVMNVGSGTSAGLEIRGTDATGAGQTLYIFNDSASPAANDAIGQLWFAGRDSAANTQTYAYMATTILDPTNGSEDANYTIVARVAGALTSILTLGPGVQNGAPTGGDKGAGTQNQTGGYYENGSRVTPGAYGMTTGGGTPALHANSFNITSITDTAVGRLTVTIATDFSDANWIGVLGLTLTTNANRMVSNVSKAAGSVILESSSATTTLADPGTGWDWAMFGLRT